MFEIRVREVAEFETLIADLRKLKDVDLQRELYQGLNRAVRPLHKVAKDSAAASLPHTGGRDVAVTRFRTTSKVEIDGKTYRRREQVRTGKTRANDSLADRVVNAKFSARFRRGRNPAVILVANNSKKNKVDLDALDKGGVRKPLFGDKHHWYDQAVPPGWWTTALNSSPALEIVRKNLYQALDEVIAKFNARG